MTTTRTTNHPGKAGARIRSPEDTGQASLVLAAGGGFQFHFSHGE